MARPEQRKRKGKPLDHSQRMNHLKAKALSKVAEQTWALNQRYKTIALLTEALRREPGNRTILMNLAAAYGRQRHYAKAEELLARLLDRGSQKASVYRQAAQTYALIDRPEKAMECYRRSLELAPDKLSTVPTLIELAGLYERRHQLADAKAAVEEALQYDPTNEEALLAARGSVASQRRGRNGRGKAASARSSTRNVPRPLGRKPVTSWLNGWTISSNTTMRFRHSPPPNASFNRTPRRSSANPRLSSPRAGKSSKCLTSRGTHAGRPRRRETPSIDSPHSPATREAARRWSSRSSTVTTKSLAAMSLTSSRNGSICRS